MSWAWTTCLNEDYWTGSGLEWTGSSWTDSASGLNWVYLEENSESPLVDRTARSVRVTIQLDEAPNDYWSKLEMVTTHNQTSGEIYLSDDTVHTYEWSFTPAVGERLYRIRLYAFGYWYETGLITLIQQEVLDETIEPVWCNYFRCRELLV